MPTSLCSGNRPNRRSPSRWDEEARTFPDSISGTSDGSGQQGPTLSGATLDAVRSPIRRVRDWLVAGGTFSVTYAARSVPQSIYGSINRVIDYPRGGELIGLPKFTNRFYLRLSPQIERRGNAAQITERALLGKDGGIEAARIIYSNDALSFSRTSVGKTGLSAGPAGGGLNTKGL